MPRVSTAGKILIATPAISDGNFDQSVIFMVHHDATGALGVIINTPSALAVDELLPRWGDLVADPGVIFNGGPVETNGFVAIGHRISARDEDFDEGMNIPGTDLVTVDLEGDPALAAAHVDRLRLFRGYAGWGAHQLETELTAGAWFTVEPEPTDMWSVEPTTLYEQVLLRQKGDLRWFANAPLDPSQN